MSTATRRRRNPAPRTAGSWRVALRVARRDAWRHRGRSAGVFVMIMVPVLLVVAGTTLLRTDDLSAVEGLPRELGAADASITDSFAGQSVEQGPLPEDGWVGGDVVRERPGDAAATIAEVLGPGTRTLALYDSMLPSALGSAGSISVIEADLADPMLKGMVRLREGRFPAALDEVAVTVSAQRRGAAVGSSIVLSGVGPLKVVGVVDQTTSGDQVFVLPSQTGGRFNSLWAMPKWLVTTPGGVSWDDVRELNTYGMVVTSRQVVTDPPKVDPPSLEGLVIEGGSFEAIFGMLFALVATMALLELALLAGPAFAVGAARQTRALGLVVAQGGSRRDVRRIVLAQAVVIGGLAVLTGAALGILLSRLGYPWLGVITAGQVGPFEAHWTDALLAMALGLAVALAAAMLPARAVARLSPASALAGRTTRARARRWPAALGLVLIAVGAAAALAGARSVDGQVASINAAAVLVTAGTALLIVGAVLIAPVGVAVLGRAASWLPTSMRYALRDMGRNQLRTSPAVAAVIAVVAGAMAVGVIAASASAAGRASYSPTGPPGEAVVNLWAYDGAVSDLEPQDWQRVQALVLANVPGGQALAVPGIAPLSSSDTLVLTDSDLVPPGLFGPGSVGALEAAGPAQGWFGSNTLVGPSGLAAVAAVLTDEQRGIAEQALAQGQAVALTAWDGPRRGTVQLDVVSGSAEDYGNWQSRRAIEVPAVAVKVRGPSLPAVVILPPEVAAEAGVEPVTTALLVAGPQPLTVSDGIDLQRRINETLLGEQLSAFVAVAPVYRPFLAPALIVLLVVAFALALVGSVTASLLSMSDARPDLVTLGEVGAAPGIRRRIATTYAVATSLLGALIGTAVGVVPGKAAVELLQPGPTGAQPGAVDFWGNPIPESFTTVVPWPLVAGLVVAMPLLIGVLVFATTRSKLPRRLRME